MRKKYPNKCHILRQNTKKNIIFNRFYAFYDTETTHETNEIGTQIHKLNLGWILWYDRYTGFKQWHYFTTYDDFWEFILSKFKDNNVKTIIIISHNQSFDLKIVDGLSYLTLTDWEVETACLKPKQFFIHFKKDDKYIKIWDSLSWASCPLWVMGESVGYPKFECNVDIASQSEIKKYCFRDVEIVFHWVTRFLSFLESNQLTELRPTIASISKASFLRKFYNQDQNPVFVHSMREAVKLERAGYSGAITDCFKIGSWPNKTLYYFDLNSSYPNEMCNDLPIKLVRHTNDKLISTKAIEKMFYSYIDNSKYGVLANVDIELKPRWAWILVKGSVNKVNKSLFLSGRFNSTFCEPDLKFIMEHGRIIRVREISVFLMKNIFNPFVKFFYENKKQASINNDLSLKMMNKLILNSSYGWPAQKEYGMKYLKSSPINQVKKFTEKIYVKGELIVTSQQIQLGHKIFEMTTNNMANARDSFVAISGWITCLGRQSLVKHMLICGGRRHLWYCDTDSLITDSYGREQLLKAGVVDKYRLGALDLQYTLKNLTICAPKFYQFDYFNKKENKWVTKRVCRGKNVKADIIYDTDEFMLIENEQWETMQSALRTGNMDKQIISKLQKMFSKTYDSGTVDKNGNVTPYHVDDLGDN